MPRKPQVYTARFKRADDGAADAAYKKAKTIKSEKKTEPKKATKTANTKETKPAARPAKKAEPKKQAETKEKIIKPKAPPAKAQKAEKAEKAETAVKRRRAAAAAEPAAQEKKPARTRRKPEENAEKGVEKRASARRGKETAGTAESRWDARKREKAQLAARERKRILDRTGGFPVLLMTFLTVAFDVLGLLLCAVRGSALDQQALTLMLVLAPLTAITALLLPRLMGIDPLLMALTNFLCGVSIVILYTVAPERGARQALFYAVGVAVMLVMSLAVSRLRKWRGITVLAMMLGVGALLLPLAFGEWYYGAKNWVNLPVIGSFQPSEFVKLSLVLVLAYFFSTHRTVWQMMPALLFAAACLVLLMLQRDLGTALIYYITTLALFYAACGNVPLTLIGFGGGAGAAMLGYKMFAHVKVRVAMWRNPWSDALDKGYQIIQALLAIGSGGLFGVGLGQGTPEKIPAYYNDFIFAVVCEQLGMVFGICVIVVYVLLVMRGVSLCMRSRRSFDLLLGCGVCAMLGVQTFMIVAGVIKMIPLTGVTMPFMSYGGSSLISCMAMMGILHGIGARAQEELEEDILG